MKYIKRILAIVLIIASLVPNVTFATGLNDEIKSDEVATLVTPTATPTATPTVPPDEEELADIKDIGEREEIKTIKEIEESKEIEERKELKEFNQKVQSPPQGEVWAMIDTQSDLSKEKSNPMLFAVDSNHLLVKHGPESFSWGSALTGCALKWVESDASNPDMNGKYRMVYCLEYEKASPDGILTFNGGGTLGKQFTYVLFYGCRYWGELNTWSEYSTGTFDADYWITQTALHIINGEYSLSEVLPTISNQLVRDCLNRLVNDAMNNSKYSNFTGNDYTGISFHIDKTTATLAPYTHNGVAGYATEWITPRLSDHYANPSEYLKTLTITPDTAGVITIREDNKLQSRFSMFVSQATYEAFRNGGKTITTTVKATYPKGFSAWRYRAPNPSQQDSTLLEMFLDGDKSETKTFTMKIDPKPPAPPEPTPEPTPEPAWERITINKKDAETGIVLPGVEFTVYEWSGSEQTYKEHSKMTYRSARQLYESEELKETTNNNGRYRVRETKGQVGYFNDGWTRDFNVREDNNFTFNVTNRAIKPSVQIAKKANKTTNAVLENGKYKGTKDAGIYYPDQTVDYTLTVTNNGNTTIQKLRIKDMLDAKLVPYVKSSAFDLKVGQTLTSTKGSNVSVTSVNGNEAVLNELKASDSVVVHFKAVLKDISSFKVENSLNNVVTVNGEYFDGEKSQPLREDKDEDDIKLGLPRLLVAKKADKTTNAVLANGKYTGTKDAGTYYPDQKVDYTLTATNNGNVALTDVIIKDAISNELLPFVKEASFALKVGEVVKSTKGADVKVLAVSSNSITLDRLAVGDSVDVHYIATLVDISKFKITDALNNIVTANAKYNTDEGDKNVPEDKDEDDVKIGLPKLLVAKKADKTTNAVLSNGKYTGSKDAGTYYPDQKVDYTLTVTNAGNVVIKDVILKDTISNELLPFVKEAGFALKAGDVVKSTKGIDVKVLAVSKDTITLDRLAVGDSVNVHYIATLADISKFKVIGPLNNVVTADATYTTDGGDKKVPGDKDEDDIKIVLPKLLVAKKADKTTNAVLSNGKYTGSKDAGVYYPDQKIDYTLTATNAGNIALKDIILKDTISNELLPFVKEASFTLKAGDVVKSTKGIDVKVLAVNKDTITLDRLAAGDSVDIHYIATLVDISKFKIVDALNNVVTADATYTSDSGDKRVPGDKDEDDIKIVLPKLLVAKKADKTTNAVLVNGKYTGTKDAGVYYPDQIVDYRLTATNAGNVALKDIIIKDTISNELLPFIKEAGFRVKVGDIVKSTKGIDVKVLAVSNDTVTLDRLTAGDSVDIHYMATLVDISKFKIVDALNNVVTANAKYTTDNGDRNVLEDRDEDDVKIGLPKLLVAKKADKTTNAVLTEGKYTGTKDAGVYYPDQKIDYTLTATNAGNVDLKNVILKDTISNELLPFVKEAGFTLKVGDIVKSTKGIDVKILAVSNDTVTLDRLTVGDSVDIHYIATLVDISKFEIVDALNNVVTANAKYTTDTGDKDVPEDQDEDDVEIGLPKLLVAKKADKTTNAVLTDGKYTGTKDAGMYYPDQVVDYMLTVTNAGNVNIKDVSLKDTISAELQPFVKAASFQLEVGDVLKSTKGVDVTVLAVSQDTITLDGLAVDDSVDVHYLVTLVDVSKFEIVEALNNIVIATAKYPTEDGDKDVPEDEDDDDILLGKPSIQIAKKADKTTNAILEDGKYKGSKDAGEYTPDQVVDYTLTATNNGNVALKNVIIKDTMDDKLTPYVKAAKYDLKEGQEIETTKGDKVTVMKVDSSTVVLDRLAVGDSLDVHYLATLKDMKSFTKAQELNNIVTTNAEYETDKGDKPTPEDSDEDDIKVPEVKEPQNIMSPKTGDTTTIALYLGCLLAAISVLTVLAYKRKKNKEI